MAPLITRLRVRTSPISRLPGDPVLELDGAGAAGGTDAGSWAPNEVGRVAIGATDAVTDAGLRTVEVVVGGWRFELEVEDAHRAALRERTRRADHGRAAGGPIEVRAIIPGRVVRVDVTMGERVGPGAHLLVLEAMKMQNELRAPHAGTVARVAVTAGLTVERGDLLLVIDPAEVDGPGLGPTDGGG
jgi:biotin carboxyl carrier protein